MSLKNRTIKMLTVVSTGLLLAACGTDGESADSENTEVNVEEALAAEPSGEEVVLVSNNGSNNRDQFILEQTEAAGFNVEYVSLGGADVTARVISEVENPTTNVVWGPTQFNFDDMIEADALYEWTPTWVDAIGDYDRENGYSYAYETQPKLWLENPETVSETPATVNDLWENEAFHGQYTIPSNFGGTTNRAIVGSILGQYLDSEGELGVSDEGWEAMQSFLDNGVQTPEGEDNFVRLADGTTPITFDGASNIITNLSNMEFTPEIIYFENGQPSNVNEVGVVNNDDPAVIEESLRLADFLGSAEFIGAFSAEFGNLITNSEAQDQMPEQTVEIAENFTEQELDWDTINANLDEWVAKIELEML